MDTFGPTHERSYDVIGKRFGVSGKTAWTYVNMRRVEERT